MMDENQADPFEAGGIYVDPGARVPTFLQLQAQSTAGRWAAVGNARSRLKDEIRKAGWVFFFMAGKIEATAFGFDGQKALGAALHRLSSGVKAQRCNCFEVMHITRKQFLGISCVNISAHACHLQEGLVWR